METEEECGCFAVQMGKLFSKSKSRSNRNTRYGEESENATACNQTEMMREFPPIHSDAVTSVAAVGPGCCVTGSKDQSVCVFDFKLGKLNAKWAGHNKEVTKVAYGALSQTYFSASRDKNVHMWRLGNTVPELTFAGHELVVTGLALNSDCNQLVTGSRDNSMRLWDTQTGQLTLHTSVTRNLISHVHWAPGSDSIAQTGEDKEVRLWDARTLQVVRSYPRKQYIQTCCDISEDLNYLLTCSNGFQGQGCEATLWDMRTSDILYEFKGHTETVACCKFIPVALSAGRHIVATSSNDCTVKIWDRNSRECLTTLSLPGSGPLTSMAVFDDASICVSSFNSGTYQLQLLCSPDGSVSLQQKAKF